MEKLDMFQDRFGKLDEFGWWCMESIKTDTGTQITSKEFQEGLFVRGVRNSLAAQNHQKNEWKSWSGMANMSNYCAFKYSAHTGLWRIYTFWNNVHDWSYFSCSNNKILGKPGGWTKYATQTGNLHKTFSIKSTYFILAVCCTKGNYTCWRKVVKHASSIKKRSSWYLCWNFTTSERVPYLPIYYTENSFFTQHCTWRNIF